MNNDKIIINRNGKVITGIHDHHIYDLLYKNVSIGYFAEYYLENVVKSIEETGFFDGKNYDFRMKNTMGIHQNQDRMQLMMVFSIFGQKNALKMLLTMEMEQKQI